VPRSPAAEVVANGGDDAHALRPGSEATELLGVGFHGLTRALWIRPLPKKGIVFHSLRHTTATLLARAKVHPSVAQKILRHANIETTLATYTHVDGIEDMRAAVAKLDFGPLEERAPAPVVPLRKAATFATNLLPAAVSPKAEAPDHLPNRKKIRGLHWSGRLDLNQRPLAPQPRNRAVQPSSAIPNPAQPLMTHAAQQSNGHYEPAHFAEILLPLCCHPHRLLCASWAAGSSGCSRCARSRSGSEFAPRPSTSGPQPVCCRTCAS
jgi:Phage integrase family